MPIRVAILGVGNCASALVQGVYYYSQKQDSVGSSINDGPAGLMRSKIGNYSVEDIDFVLGYDVDDRKIGKTIKEAIFQKPNCCFPIAPEVVHDTTGRFDGVVHLAPVLDGVANHMKAETADDAERFYLDLVDIGENLDWAVVQLREYKVDVLLNYLPVGSQQATELWADACIKAGVCMVNCIPVFIASDPIWSRKFADAKLAIIGDDMKSQFGASIVSQMLQELAHSRGHKVKVHVQQNSGGNTDFLNMTDATRLASKKVSKENVLKQHGDAPEYWHAGPSDYIRCYGDKKVATFHLELEGFGGAPVLFDAKLEVQDSPNSAGVVIDAIRYVMTAKERGMYGAVHGASAFTQKSPPLAMPLSEAIEQCDILARF